MKKMEVKHIAYDALANLHGHKMNQVMMRRKVLMIMNSLMTNIASSRCCCGYELDACLAIITAFTQASG